MGAKYRSPYRGTVTDLTGKKVSRLTVVRHSTSYRTTNGAVMHYWECKCSCGKTVEVESRHINRKDIHSCGCLAVERAIKARKVHGMSGAGGKRHPIYNSWSTMIQRCSNPNNPGFKHYGYRGIKVSKEWLVFNNFKNDMLSTWRPGLTIERKDVNGDYKLSNCRWATKAEQPLNTRRTLVVKIGNEKMSLKLFSSKIGIPYNTLKTRLRLGRIQNATISKAYPKLK